jgi:hypothetical protein
MAQPKTMYGEWKRGQSVFRDKHGYYYLESNTSKTWKVYVPSFTPKKEDIFVLKKTDHGTHWAKKH